MKTRQKSNTKKYILIGVGVVAAGVGGYLLYRHLKAKKDENDVAEFTDAVENGSFKPNVDPLPSPPKTSYSPASSKPAVVYNQFPLKYGSKGTTVRDLQTALNKKYGTKIDVDGDWRNQTETALKAKGMPTVIDSETYAKIILGTFKVGGSAPTKPAATGSQPSAAAISKLLHTAISKDDIYGAISALKKISNISRYKSVNTEFQKTKIWGYDYMLGPKPVSKTIVTALHDAFSSEEYRKKINTELFRIGLKYNGSKWSLSGVSHLQRIVTIRPAQVWDVSGRSLRVPSQTILGDFLDAKNGVTKFVTLDNRHLFVNTQEIRYSHD